MKFDYSLLTVEEMDLIHEKTLDVLENVGVVFEYDPIIEEFRKRGVKTEGRRVYIPRNLVEHAIKTVPRQFEWKGRGNSVMVGDPYPSVCGPAYGPIYIYKDGNYSDVTTEDYINFHKLIETSDALDVASPNTMEPFQIDKDIRAKYRMATTLMYSTKPTLGLAGGEQIAKMAIDMTRQFYGVSDESTLLLANINCSSPLHYGPTMAETMYVYAKNNQACTITGGAMAGLTGPPSMAGLAVLTNAEILSGLTLTQLVREGSPVIQCSSVGGTDLRTNVWAVGSFESVMTRFIGKDFKRYYKGIPSRVNGALTDSKYDDYQSGKESAMCMFATLTAGANFVSQSCGILDSFNSIGYEKFILDEELINEIKHFMNGYEVSGRTIMYDRIAKAGPGGNYIARTEKIYYENFFLPKYDIRDTHGNWLASGKKSCVDMARQEYKRRLEEYQLPDLDDVQKKIIKDSIPEY